MGKLFAVRPIIELRNKHTKGGGGHKGKKRRKDTKMKGMKGIQEMPTIKELQGMTSIDGTQGITSTKGSTMNDKLRRYQKIDKLRWDTSNNKHKRGSYEGQAVTVSTRHWWVPPGYWRIFHNDTLADFSPISYSD